MGMGTFGCLAGGALTAGRWAVFVAVAGRSLNGAWRVAQALWCSGYST